MAAESLDINPKQIGNYSLEEHIGAGSVGEVFRARRAGLPRDFALKLVSISGTKAKEELERLSREILALSRFHHPHIIGLVDAFPVGRRQVAIVMDYVKSRPLSETLTEMTAQTIMLVIRQIASALLNVHREEIIHRDIKPSNILVTWPLPGQPHAYVIDFGITRHSNDVRQTEGFIGSPAYASPEQVAGGEVSPSTDVFSLGAIGFEAITGVAPFDADSVLSSLHKHVRWSRPDLSPFYDRRFPQAFCELVEDCLEFDPVDRPDSMEAIIDSIEQVLGTSEVLMGRSSSVVEDDSEPDASPSPSNGSRKVIGRLRPVSSSDARETREKSASPEDSRETAVLEGTAHSSAGETDSHTDMSEQVWIEDGVPYYQRPRSSSIQFLDVGNDRAVAVAIDKTHVAFATKSNSVHVLDESGLRRMFDVPAPVQKIELSDGRLRCTLGDGELFTAEF